MDGSEVTASSAQAYVDSLAAAFNSASMMASSAYAQQIATPVCLPLATGGTFEADELRMFPPTPAPCIEPETATVPALAAVQAPAGPADTAAAMPAAPASVNTAAAGITPTAAVPAAVPAVPALGATIVPAAAAVAPTAAVAPAAAASGVTPAVLPTSALLSSQFALQAAAMGATTPPLAAAAAANPANVAAMNAATMNALAANPALAAAAATTPSSMAALNAANMQMLMGGGLSAATALMPTGATPAQIAAGMPAVQAVPVMVSTQQPTNISSLAGSTMSGTSTITGTTAAATTAAAAATANSTELLNKRLAAAGLTPTGGLITTSSAVNPSAMNTTAGLFMPQSQTYLPNYAGSQLSMSTLDALKSQSVASSVMSVPGAFSAGLPSGTMLEPMFSTSAGSTASAAAAAAAAAAASSVASASTTASGSKKVRVLLSSGGEYEELPMSSTDGSSTGTTGSGNRGVRWRYVGGETRLVGLSRTDSFSSFLQQLSKATSAVWDESCRLTYDLPGPEGDSGVLVDLIDDEDLEMMWEEFESYASVRPGFKLHIYAQLGSKSRSAGGSSTEGLSADSNVLKPETHSAGSNPAHAAAAAAAAAAAVGSGSTGAAAGTGSSSTGLTSSEYDELVGELVSESPKMNLADLESKLEIISPEDLTPVRLLGTGGFGEVYLCRWHSCDVAVKCLNPNLLVPDGAMGSISKENVAELLKEASILGSVRHPNVVWVYGLVLPPLDPAMEIVKSHLGPGQGIDAVKMATNMANKHRQEVGIQSQIRPPALVTEYLASGSLRAAITRRADFLSRDSVRIKLALDAARGMDYLHSKHIVHFDLKTANLLVGMRDKAPICKVADMGLSKQKQQTFVTGVATLRGTLPWIAPEIIKTPGTVTQAVDVYSFGVVLWELWTLREPFEGLNYHALLHMMSSSTEAVRPAMPGTPEFEGECSPEPCPGWADLITDCLDNNPDNRPTFRQVVGRLESMLRANRMAKRRTTSGPPTATGTNGAAAATAGSLGAGSLGQADV